MKPAQRHLKKRKWNNKMNNQSDQSETKNNVQALPKWRQWVKDNKAKLLAVIGVGLSAIAGDAVGITDLITAWFF